MSTRFPIRFERWYAVLSSGLLLPPSDAYLEIEDGEVECHMGWAFHARFPRAAVRRAARANWPALSRGVHGFGGRWIVNGAGAPLLTIDFDPPQRARVLAFSVGLRRLVVSVDDPEALAARLGASGPTSASIN
jgi:hypothetical protein